MDDLRGRRNESQLATLVDSQSLNGRNSKRKEEEEKKPSTLVGKRNTAREHVETNLTYINYVYNDMCDERHPLPSFLHSSQVQQSTASSRSKSSTEKKARPPSRTNTLSSREGEEDRHHREVVDLTAIKGKVFFPALPLPKMRSDTPADVPLKPDESQSTHSEVLLPSSTLFIPPMIETTPTLCEEDGFPRERLQPAAVGRDRRRAQDPSSRRNRSLGDHSLEQFRDTQLAGERPARGCLGRWQSQQDSTGSRGALLQLQSRPCEQLLHAISPGAARCALSSPARTATYDRSGRAHQRLLRHSLVWRNRVEYDDLLRDSFTSAMAVAMATGEGDWRWRWRAESQSGHAVVRPDRSNAVSRSSQTHLTD